MTDYVLEVIPKPKEGTATIFEQKNKEPFVSGDAEDNYLCGNCLFILGKNVLRKQLKGIVLICPKCGKFNATK